MDLSTLKELGIAGIAVAFAQNSVGVGNGSTVGFTTLKADESNFFQFF